MVRSARPGSHVQFPALVLAFTLLVSACGGTVPGIGTPPGDAGRPLLTDADIDAAADATAADVLHVVGFEAGVPDDGDDESTEFPSIDSEPVVGIQAMPPGATGVVAYARHDPTAVQPWSLVRVDAATQSSTTIYEGQRDIQSVAVSLDGDSLVFAMRHEVGSHFEIYRFVVSLGAVERLTTTSADSLDVSIAANGATIAWSGLAPNGTRTVYVRQYAGASFSDTLLASTVDQIQPSLSGDGQHLVFVRPGSRYYVYLYDRAAETYDSVTSRSGEMSHPSVSDGADKVLWYIPSNRNVRLKYLSSGGAITVTKHWSDIEHPFLTSDGEFVVFGRQDAGGLDVFSWSEDSGELFQLTSTEDPVNHRGMSWQVGALSRYQLNVERSGSGTVTSDPEGIDCGSTCSATFSAGTSVGLQAVPADGWSFSGWAGACTGTSTCTASMTGATSVLATFVEDVEPTGPAIVPTSTSCGTAGVGSECTVTIALRDASGSYEGLEFRFDSPSFELVRANSVIASTSGDCLAQAGPSKVIVVCSEPFVGSGDVTVLTLRRISTSSAVGSVHAPFLAPGAGLPLVPADGGSLTITGSG